MTPAFVTALLFIGTLVIYDRFITPDGRRTFFANPSLDGTRAQPARELSQEKITSATLAA